MKKHLTAACITSILICFLTHYANPSLPLAECVYSSKSMCTIDIIFWCSILHMHKDKTDHVWFSIAYMTSLKGGCAYVNKFHYAAYYRYHCIVRYYCSVVFLCYKNVWLKNFKGRGPSTQSHVYYILAYTTPHPIAHHTPSHTSHYTESITHHKLYCIIHHNTIHWITCTMLTWNAWTVWTETPKGHYTNIESTTDTSAKREWSWYRTFPGEVWSASTPKPAQRLLPAHEPKYQSTDQ